MFAEPDSIAPLEEVRRALKSKPPTLLDLFEYGEKLSNYGEAAEFTSQRVALLGALTTDYISHAITCAIAQEGMLARVYQAPFGSYVQQILDDTSYLYDFHPDVAVLAMDWRDIVDELAIDASLSEIESTTSAKVNSFRKLWDALENRLECRIIQHTLVPPLDRFRGIADRLSPASSGSRVRLLNEELLKAGNGRVYWIDMEALAWRVGIQNWSARRFYYSGRFGFDQRLLPHYLPAFRGAWRAACSRTKKVLVVDLDNTLWGGVIGDDGLDGISLGPASPAGEAYADWQRYIKLLRCRGVILAVCSKNSAEIGLSGLLHSHSVLKKEDFAAIVCSWDDKVQGLTRIARSLDLSLDSFVFADDNPAECDLIRRSLPDVAVVYLGNDPALFIEQLDYGCWFDLQRYTTEDFGRANAYASRLAAVAEQPINPTDIGTYLTSLEMVGRLYEPEQNDVARIAQLEQKTNQFNLTTRRYSETAIRAFLDRDDVIILAFSLADRFGNHGLVSAVIGVENGDALTIDSWTMSCRIFSRSAEQFIMLGLMATARKRGLTSIQGIYEATPKNRVVADLYPRLGFTALPAGNLWSRSLVECDWKTDDLVTYVKRVD